MGQAPWNCTNPSSTWSRPAESIEEMLPFSQHLGLKMDRLERVRLDVWLPYPVRSSSKSLNA